MMQTYSTFKFEEHNDISYGFNRDKQAINLIISKNIITVSLSKLLKTYGRRYMKSIASGSYTSFRSLGSDVVEAWSYTNTHTRPDDHKTPSGAVTAYTTGYNNLTSTNITPKYILMGNELTLLSTKLSFPEGAIFMTEEKTTLVNFDFIDDKYLFIGATADGGATTHDHTVFYGSSKNTLKYFGNDLRNPGELDPFNTEIDDRLELFTICFNGTYSKDLDPIPVGMEILQDKASSVPSNYSDITSNTGLLRFADSTGEIDNTGGTETHTHTRVSASVHDEGTYTSNDYSSFSTNDHMPPYKAVRIIKRVS